jgi:hypothetical protein
MVIIEAEAMRMPIFANVEVIIPGLGKIMEDTCNHLSFLAHKSKATLLM